MTKYEYYDVDDDSISYSSGSGWVGMVFTVGTVGTNENFNISSVKLKAFRVGSPGTLTVSIRAVDAAHKPTGSDLTSGTIDGDTFTTNTAGVWYEITLTSYELSASTEYAIVWRATGGDASNKVGVLFDNGDGAYTGGDRATSFNSGSTWSVQTDDDCMFEVHGTAVVTTVEESMSFGVRRRTLV